MPTRESVQWKLWFGDLRDAFIALVDVCAQPTHSSVDLPALVKRARKAHRKLRREAIRLSQPYSYPGELRDRTFEAYLKSCARSKRQLPRTKLSASDKVANVAHHLGIRLAEQIDVRGWTQSDLDALVSVTLALSPLDCARLNRQWPQLKNVLRVGPDAAHYRKALERYALNFESQTSTSLGATSTGLSRPDLCRKTIQTIYGAFECGYLTDRVMEMSWSVESCSWLPIPKKMPDELIMAVTSEPKLLRLAFYFAHQMPPRFANTDDPMRQIAITLRILAEQILDEAKSPEIEEPVAVVPPVGGKRSGHRKTWLPEAMMLVNKEPDLSDAVIACRCRINPGQLSRSKTYQTAAKIARGRHLPKGTQWNDRDTGRQKIEAEGNNLNPLARESLATDDDEALDVRIDRDMQIVAQRKAQRKM